MNNTKERPVILTAQEVNAVLAGDKTQHRVAIENTKDTQCLFNGDWRYDGRDFLDSDGLTLDPKGAHYVERLEPSEGEENQYTEDYRCVGHCPLGKVGDRLWVQEDWRVGAWREAGGVLAIDYKASPEITNTPWVQVSDDEYGKKFEAVWIAVTDELDSKSVKTDDDDHYHWPAGQAPLDWRDASTMERWASRLLSEITDIRIERLNDISEQDAIAEGIKPIHSNPADRVGPNHFTKSNGWYHCSRPTAAEVFTEMYGVSDDFDKYGDNPWVWVVEFKAIKESSNG